MISVCMATYNGERYIVEQLQSILSQLSLIDEVIISDDHSTDSTLDVIRSLNDERIKIFMNTMGKGYTRNFENALSKSKGEFIFLSDQDDVWIEGKLSRMMQILQKADFVVGDAVVVNEALEVIQPSHFKQYDVRTGFIHNLFKTRYIGACMGFKRSVLDVALPFPPNSNLCPHDYWIAVVTEMYFKTQLDVIPSLLYRRHGKNASSGGTFSHRGLLTKVYVRVYTLYHLMLKLLNRLRLSGGKRES